jgi:hypothetical protein
MSVESEEDVAKETEKRNTVRDSVMGGKNEVAVRLLMEQHSTEERSLIGGERCIYLFGDLPLPPGKGRCNHAKRDPLAGDVAKMRDAVEGGVNAGREQRVALLYHVKRVTPFLDGCVAGDSGCKSMVGWKVLVE